MTTEVFSVSISEDCSPVAVIRSVLDSIRTRSLYRTSASLVSSELAFSAKLPVLTRKTNFNIFCILIKVIFRLINDGRV